MASTTDPDQPVGEDAVGEPGRVPWYIQQKYIGRDAPINGGSDAAAGANR